MNGHLNGARMADDSSRGRVVARPSSIQDEDVGPKSGGSQHRRTDRRRRTGGGRQQCWGLWFGSVRAQPSPTSSANYCTALHSTTVPALPAAFIRYHLRRAPNEAPAPSHRTPVCPPNSRSALVPSLSHDPDRQTDRQLACLLARSSPDHAHATSLRTCWTTRHNG